MYLMHVTRSIFVRVISSIFASAYMYSGRSLCEPMVQLEKRPAYFPTKKPRGRETIVAVNRPATFDRRRHVLDDSITSCGHVFRFDRSKVDQRDAIR